MSVAFWLGLLIGDRDPTWRAFALAAVWPLLVVLHIGSWLAYKGPFPTLRIGEQGTDSAYAWKRGVRFTLLFGTTNTRLYFARAPKPEAPDNGGNGGAPC